VTAHNNLVHAWTNYLFESNWQQLCADVEPVETGCGQVYDLENSLDRPDEGIAIADMRNLDIADPHYHANNQTEVYIVLQGTGTVVVGDRLLELGPYDVVIAPPMTAHYTVPHDQLVLGVINTPPFNPETYVSDDKSDASVHFDAERFHELAKRGVDNALATILHDLTVDLDAWAAVFHVPNASGTMLSSRARYNIPDDWAAMSHAFTSNGMNVRAYRYEHEIVEHGLDDEQPPGKAVATRHPMTATAIVPVPGLGTLQVIADTQDYAFDTQRMHLMRNIAGAAAMIVDLGEAP
jgi:mannose-6-phosphate isomerase-like protein (cupin superfamily)